MSTRSRSTLSSSAHSVESTNGESSVWSNSTEPLSFENSITLMEVSLGKNDNRGYFWDTVLTINELCDGVERVIRNSQTDNRVVEIEHHRIICENVGNWIPLTIFGYLLFFMYIVRSAYTAFITGCKLLRCNKKTVVITDSHYIAIPILNKLGCKVIHLESFRTTLSDYKTSDTSSERLRRFQKRCLSQAALIITPCENISEKFRHELGLEVNTLYPPAAVETIHVRLEERPTRHLMRPINRSRSPRFFNLLDDAVRFHFLAIGPYAPQSNFEILIDAFVTLLQELEPAHGRRLSLVIVGTSNSPEQLEYRRQLQYYAESFNVNAQICLYMNMTVEQRWVLYWSAFAVLNANTQATYVPSILEGFFFAKLIITVNNDFVQYVVEDCVSGIIIIDLDADEFAATISNALQYDGPDYKFMCLRGAEEYQNCYSFDYFTASWENFLAIVESD